VQLRRIFSQVISKKEWLNSTSLVFQVTIILGVLSYYIFIDYFSTVFYGFTIILMALCILAISITLYALMKDMSWLKSLKPVNILFLCGLLLLFIEAFYHSAGAEILAYPHVVVFSTGIVLLLAGTYFVLKISEFENKLATSRMLWLTGNVLFLFAVSKHYLESSAFSIRDSIMLTGSAIISFVGIFQYVLLENYNRELESAMVLGDAKYVAGKFDEALEHYEQGLGIDEKNAYLLGRKGSALLHLGMTESAFRVYSMAVELYPANPDLLIGAGVCASKMQKYSMALEFFQKAEKIQKTPELYNNIGNVLSSMGRIEDGLKAYARAIEMEPMYESPYLNAANVLTREKRYREAISLVTKLLELKPNCAEAYYALGMIQLEMGEYEKSIESIDAAILLKPSYSDAWIRRGIALARAREGGLAQLAAKPMPGDTRKSAILNMLRERIFSTLEEYKRIAGGVAERLEQGVDVHPPEIESLGEEAKHAFEVKDFTKVESIAKRVLEREPENLDALILLANSAEKLGRYGDACNAYRKACKLKPSPELFMRCAIASAMAGFWLEAVEVLDELLETHRDYVDGWVLKGVLLYFLEAPMASLECFEYAIAFQPDNQDGWYGKGLALMKLGLENEAIACFSKAKGLSMQFSEIFAILPDKQKTLEEYLRMAMQFANQKKFNDAMRILNFLLKMKPDDENICYFAGIVYATMRKYRKAEELIRKAMQNDPDKEDFVITLSEILRKTRRAQESRALLRRFVEEHKKAGIGVYLECALACIALDDFKEAQRYLDMAEEIEPDNEKIRQIRKMYYQGTL